MEDAGAWGLNWAAFAAIVGLSLTIVATTLWRRRHEEEGLDFSRGYDAMASVYSKREF